MTEEQLKAQAESRLAQAVADNSLEDHREAYRVLMRSFKEHQPAKFEQARSHYEDTVLPGIAEPGSDPVALLIDYGSYLGRLQGPGKTIEVAPDGRATPLQPPPKPATLVLFVPDDPVGNVLVLCRPAQPSPSQQATLQLLVR